MSPDVFAREARALIVDAEFLCAGSAAEQAKHPQMPALWGAERFVRALNRHPATRGPIEGPVPG